MMDGPVGSIHNAFSDAFTVIQRDEPVRVRPRSLLTTDRAVLESVWEHKEETVRVYCNYPPNSPQCRRVFYKGAEDTIIRLPHHVGDGPWARIVSMAPEYQPKEDLPAWVKQKRETSGVYVVKSDYNFHLIKRQDEDGPVKMRIDFTNEEGYWVEVTNATVTRKLECYLSDTGVTFTAGMDITADIRLQMDTRYAYYFSGTVVAPKVNDMYAFVRTQPKIIAGITLAGDAALGYATEPEKLINTLTYPGLSIKGIAGVGPALDIWGQLDGSVTVSGQMRAGLTYTLKPIEVFMPNDTGTHNIAPHLVYGNESSALALRQEENSHEDDSKSDMEFTVGGNKFTCNSMPARCGGSMMDQTSGIETRDLGFNRLGSPSGYGAAHTKRATSKDDCAVLPRLYYNCKTAFMDWTFVVPTTEGGTGKPNTMNGICRTLEHLMNDYRSINNQRGRYSGSRARCKGRGCTLTIDASNSRQNTRRTQACRSRTTPRRSKCVNDNDVRKLWLWGSKGHRRSAGLTSCDEFPFASSEESGNNYDSDAQDMDSLFGTKTVCLLRNLETNVRYFNARVSGKESSPDPTNKLWKSWTDAGWERDGWDDPLDPGNNMQRQAKYNRQLARPAEAEDDNVDFPGTTHVVTGTMGNKGSGASITDLDDVLCAVSTMDQARYQITDGEHNA
ncbi:hypothetical protein LA080_009710 [Diaporthe eres]|nr:hypothetical protein LA080_009710 [Diaporthe eres]